MFKHQIFNIIFLLMKWGEEGISKKYAALCKMKIGKPRCVYIAKVTIDPSTNCFSTPAKVHGKLLWYAVMLFYFINCLH